MAGSKVFEKNPLVHFFDSLEEGIEWCEERMLSEEPSAPADSALALGDGTLPAAGLRPYLEEVELEAGQSLFRQGEAADSLYFVGGGRLSVWIAAPDGKRHRVRCLRPGTVVGDVATYLRQHRSATVIADDASSLYRLTYEAFQRMQTEAPALATAVDQCVVRQLASRLVELDRTVHLLLR
jgi:CRP-like cAMP-binding protein